MTQDDYTEALRRAAVGVPAFVAQAEAAFPELKAKSLCASKTFWGMLIATVLSGAIARYNLAVDADTSQALAGLLEMGAVAFFRNITVGPISGWFRKGSTT